jgi:hypothetical protein
MFVVSWSIGERLVKDFLVAHVQGQVTLFGGHVSESMHLVEPVLACVKFLLP